MNETMSRALGPAIIVRLTPKWRYHREEIEHGYFRAGSGWYDGITDMELMDSVRAWWRISPKSIEQRGIEYVVAYAAGSTRAVYRLDSVIGPRHHDGRCAFTLTMIESGPIFDLAVGLDGKRIEFAPGSANPIQYWIHE